MPDNRELKLQKECLRAEIRAGRQERTDASWDLGLTALTQQAAVVACYAPLPPEPDIWNFIDYLLERGVQVLLPVLKAEPAWANYTTRAQMRRSSAGILVPCGSALPNTALASAQAIAMPGLAGTLSGIRLGTGGGWYDRVLLHADPNAARILVLYDDEIYDDLPCEDWDEPVDWIVTEKQVYRTSARFPPAA
ncbi:MAG: 5-formyltetrahydrofolate cyclo-ligase [Propionibacteriaceae bacterium]|nr:5-formyltetrahydrofolate cyclo-ligase [Propionibacteriaceae bacterium]